MVEGRPRTDVELARRARAGDVDAFAELVERYAPLARRVAYLITGSTDEAEDAAQEGFVKGFLALSRFREGSAFRPWIVRIVANEAKNRRRAAGRRARYELRSVRHGPAGETNPSPEAAALTADLYTRVLAAVNRLKESDRLVLACRYFLDLTEAETAHLLRIPAGTVKSRSARALARLRRLLEEGRVDGG